MIHTIWRRRAATTVVAGASALALAAPSVSAAPAAGPDQFVGQAQALALDLDLTLPGELLNGQASKIEQLISQTLTQLDSQGKVVAKADLLSGLLEQRPLEFTGGKTSDSQTLAELPENSIVKLDVGELSYTADATNRVTKAFSELTNLEVGLTDTAGADAALEDVVKKVNGLVGTAEDAESTDAEGTLNDLLATFEEQVNAEVLDNPELPDTEAIDLPLIARADLVQLPDNVAELTNLASVRKLWSETITQTETASDAIVSTSKAGVVGMSLLGGLVKVPDFEFSSLAKTNGKPGGAVAKAVTEKLAVQLADKDLISISGDTLTVNGEVVDLGDLGLTEELNGTLDQVETVLGSILSTAGLSIEQAKETEVAAADGSHALAKTDALAISLSPLQALANQDPVSGLNVALSLLPTLAEVRADNAAPAAKTKPPAAVQGPGPAPDEQMPRTGGGAVAVLVGGLALGGAFALRRFTKS